MERALVDIRDLFKGDRDLDIDGLGIAMSRVSAFLNTVAFALHKGPANTELAEMCADSLWRFGEELSQIDNHWLQLDGGERRPTL